jgi:hypothetical protein
LISSNHSSSEYTAQTGFEKFFVNICGNAKTKCSGKAYPVVNDYFGTCGYLGTLESLKIKLVGKKIFYIYF